MRLFRTASNYTYKVYTRHIYIYTYIRVDWNLYFSLSLPLSRSFLYSHTRAYIDRLVLKKKTRRRRRRRRRRRQINESHCHYQLFFFEIFDSKNKFVNSTTIQIKSVSHKNVFLYFYDRFLYNLFKTSLVHVYYCIDMWTEVSYTRWDLFRSIGFSLNLKIDDLRIVITIISICYNSSFSK